VFGVRPQGRSLLAGRFHQFLIGAEARLCFSSRRAKTGGLNDRNQEFRKPPMTPDRKKDMPGSGNPHEGPESNSETCRNHPLISIVICTQGLRPTLARCLASLESQNCDNKEIIVVLNGARDETFMGEMARYPVRLLFEPRRGVCVARNTAIAHVRGELVAFLDDDVEAHPGWLHEIVKGFGNERIACVTGHVVPRGPTYLDRERFERLYSSPRAMSAWTLDTSDRRWVSRVRGERIGSGCNMAFRRSFLIDQTRFPEDLGAGSPIGCEDENFMFLQVVKRGFGLHHSPLAIVDHYFDGDLNGRRRRAAQLYTGGVAFTLNLLCEARGIRFRLLKAHAGSLTRIFRRAATRALSADKPEELLSYSEKFRALMKGVWLFLQLRVRSKATKPGERPIAS
jgi:glycosyltransferase involved in cell wall biosynthesis